MDQEFHAPFLEQATDIALATLLSPIRGQAWGKEILSLGATRLASGGQALAESTPRALCHTWFR